MSRKYRKLGIFQLTLLLWLAAPFAARADSTEANAIARLKLQIQAQQAETRSLQKRLQTADYALVKMRDLVNMRTLPSARNAMPAVEITNLETWWDSVPGTSGLAPAFRFRLHNVGTKPITDLSLAATYFLASGTKFGEGADGLVPNVIQVIPPGEWMTVEINYDTYRPSHYSPSIPLTVEAEVSLSSLDCTKDFTMRIVIPRKPHRLPVPMASQ
jgi:hypothetical protein